MMMPFYSLSVLKQKRMSSHSNNKGVTLLELMIVVLVITILAMFIVPSFAGFFAKSRVSSTADQLYSDLQFAKAESLRRSSQIAVIQQDGGWEKGWCVATGFQNGQTCKDIADTNILLNKVGAEAKVEVFHPCDSSRKVPQLVFWNGYVFEQNDIFNANPVTEVDRRKVPATVPPVTRGLRVTSGSGSTLAQRLLLVRPSSLLIGNAAPNETVTCPSP